MAHLFGLRSDDDVTIYSWWRHNAIKWPNCCDASRWKAISNSLDINFYPRPVWLSGIVIACVCVCVCQLLVRARGEGESTLTFKVTFNSKVKIYPNLSHFELVCTIIAHPFKLGPQNVDQRCKTPWLKSILFWEVVDLTRSNWTFNSWYPSFLWNYIPRLIHGPDYFSLNLLHV